ncbi:MAG: hypothetical protein ACQEP8_06080 [Chlamydiota bacterium]
MKKIFCILHGLTDVPLEDLGSKTPLQKAHTPNLDLMARKGYFSGVVPPAEESIETALMTLLAEKSLTGSASVGPLQARALGHCLEGKQQAFAVRLVSQGEDIVIDVSDELVNDQEGQQLCAFLNEEAGDSSIKFIHLSGPTALMITSNPLFNSDNIAITANPLKAVGAHWLNSHREAMAEILQRWTCQLQNHDINLLREDLEENYINALLFTSLSELPEIEEAFMAEKKLLYTSSLASLGAASLLGIDAAHMPPEREKYENINALLDQLDNNFKSKDNIYCEFFYLWDSTYKGDLREKVKSIEYLDKNFIAPLIDYCTARNFQLVAMPLVNSDIRMSEWASGSVPAAIYPALDFAPAPAFDEQQIQASSKEMDLLAFSMKC